MLVASRPTTMYLVLVAFTVKPNFLLFFWYTVAAVSAPLLLKARRAPSSAKRHFEIFFGLEVRSTKLGRALCFHF